MNIFDITGRGPKQLEAENLDDLEQFNPDAFDKDGVPDPIKVRQGEIDNHGWPEESPASGTNVPGTPIVPIKVTKDINLDLADIVANLDVEAIGDTKGINVDLGSEEDYQGITVGDEPVDNGNPDWLERLKTLAGVDIEFDDTGDDRGIEVIKRF